MASRPLAIGLCAAVLVAGGFAERATGNPVSWPGLLDWVVGAAFAAAALRVWAQDRTAGVLAFVAAATWYIGTFSTAPEPFGRIGTAAILLYRAPVLHLLVRITHVPFDLVVTGLAYAIVLMPASLAGPGTTGLATAVAVGASWVAVRRNADRRAATMGAIAAVVLAVAWGPLHILSTGLAHVLLPASLVGIVSLVWAHEWLDAAPDPLADLWVDLTRDARAGAPIADVIGRALGLPGLMLLHRSPCSSWVDELGGFVVTPSGGIARAPVTGGGEVALVHPDLADRGNELLAAALTAAGVAMSAGRINAELRTRAEETRASTRRLLEVGDSERRDIERRLADGPLKRLSVIRQSLSLTSSAAGRDLSEQTAAIIVELEHLTDRLYPSRLCRDPLAVRIRQLADDANLVGEVRVDSRVDDIDVGSWMFLYFFCSECLANASRHSSATKVRVGVAIGSGTLVAIVTDNGHGGATIRADGGLQGLTDRATAVGGSLAVVSPVGGPTTVRACVPLTVQPLPRM